MKNRFLKYITNDTKRLKILVLCTLILLESFVFIGAAINNASELNGRPPKESASLGIIGGADGPTSIFITGGDGNRLLEWIIKALTRSQTGSIGNDSRPDVKDGQGADGNEDGTGVKSNLPPATEKQRQEAEERGLLILINKQNPIGENYKPDDLASIKYFASDRSEAGRYMRKEAAEHFHMLVEAAAADGYELVMTTAYRSYGFQQVLWNNYVANEGEAAASRFSAKPGQSEHQSGLAADVSSPSVNYELTRDFGKTEEGLWLAENAHRFGFIIRFPEEKEDITGYLYEPWHIRYVGEPVATEIFAKDLTLEEYLGR